MSATGRIEANNANWFDYSSFILLTDHDWLIKQGHIPVRPKTTLLLD
jgi:hypothetical protein